MVICGNHIHVNPDENIAIIAVVRSEAFHVQVTVSYTMMECRSSYIHDLNILNLGSIIAEQPKAHALFQASVNLR